MEARKQFTFYSSIFEAAQFITDKAERADFYDAVAEYALNGTEPALTGPLAGMFALLRPNLDSSRKKSEAGKAGGVTASKPEATGSKPEANASKPEATGSKPEANASKPENGASEKEIEKEKEKEIEIEIEKDIEHERDSLPPVVPPRGDAPPANPKRDRLDGFDDFWKVYPKHVGKQAARKAYAKLSDGDKALLVPAIERQRLSRQWTEDGGRYIPDPATWLNEHRWEDELEPAPVPGLSPLGTNSGRTGGSFTDIAAAIGKGGFP